MYFNALTLSHIFLSNIYELYSMSSTGADELSIPNTVTNEMEEDKKLSADEVCICDMSNFI